MKHFPHKKLWWQKILTTFIVIWYYCAAAEHRPQLSTMKIISYWPKRGTYYYFTICIILILDLCTWCQHTVCTHCTWHFKKWLTASNSSWRCMWVLINKILWIVFSITNGRGLRSRDSSEPDINFWKPSNMESRCIFSWPFSLSLLPWKRDGH